MITASNDNDFVPGIKSFDDYSDWMKYFSFGVNTVLPDGIKKQEDKGSIMHLTEDERAKIYKNIYQNVTSLAETYPDVTFYYFFTPYSAAWWHDCINSGTIYKQIEAENYIIEIILHVDNIKLYSFNNRTDITTDLNNYKDTLHYGSWINSLMLRWMHDEEYLLTWDNYEDYLTQELAFYTSYDYSQLAEQEDYENDYFAAALFNEELNGVVPIKYTESTYQYVYNADRVELRLSFNDISDYKYLIFYGKKKSQQDWPFALIYAENNQQPTEIKACYYDTDHIDYDECQYLIDVSNIKGMADIILDDEYSDVILY